MGGKRLSALPAVRARSGALKAATPCPRATGRQCDGWPLQANRRRVRGERTATLQHKHHPVVWPRGIVRLDAYAYRNHRNIR